MSNDDFEGTLANNEAAELEQAQRARARARQKRITAKQINEGRAIDVLVAAEDLFGNGDPKDDLNLIDLLTNFYHACRYKGFDFDELNRTAVDHFNTEVGEEADANTERERIITLLKTREEYWGNHPERNAMTSARARECYEIIKEIEAHQEDKSI